MGSKGLNVSFTISYHWRIEEASIDYARSLGYPAVGNLADFPLTNTLSQPRQVPEDIGAVRMGASTT